MSREARVRRRSIGVLVVLVGLIVAAGVAYATIPDSTGVYTACKLNATGTIRLIDPSLPSTNVLGHCTSLETLITWNQKGLKGDPGANGANGSPGTPGADGKNGVSVTSASESPGANCPNGGSKFTSASGNTFACNGAKGDKGDTGPAGTSTSGLNGWTEVAGPVVTIQPKTYDGSWAVCPDGWELLSGGYKLESKGMQVVQNSSQEPTSNEWFVQAYNDNDYPATVQATVFCTRA